MLMHEILQFTITDTTALGAARVIQETGFAPVRVKVQNITHAQRPEINQMNYYSAVASFAGGRQSNYDATTGAETVTSKTTTTGIKPHVGGTRVYYNNPLTPTYKDQDGTAVVTGSILSANGEDRIARELPQLTATDTRYTNEDYKSMYFVTLPGIELPIAAQNADMRGDGETIWVTVER